MTETERDRIDRADALVDQSVIFREPGEVLTDVDGTPIAVAPTKVVDALVFGAIITRAEAEAAGITEETHPNIQIIEGETSEH